MRHSLGWKAISFVLIISLLSTSFYGCSRTGDISGDIPAEDNNDVKIDTEVIADIISEQIRQELNEESENSEDSLDENETTGEANSDNNQNEFDGDIIGFARNLLISEYELVYEVFHAEVALSDGTLLEGMAYTDFASYYERDDGLGGYFPAGCISFESYKIPEEELEKGLEIYDVDYEDDEFGFVYTITTDPFLEHFVIDNQYVKYGVDDNGAFTCSFVDFSREICDESLGALYSYDEERYLYNPDVGNYQPITGASLVSEIDYEELEKEINSILEKQDELFLEIDVETQIAFAQECVKSYLLSLQEETFLGCKTADLLEELKKLDPKECIRITPDGAMVMDIDSTLPTEPTALTKWLVGAACIINVGGCIALTIWVPAGTVAWSALSASTIEIFMEVVVENRNLEHVQWSKVGVAAVTGALLAWVCPAGASAVAGQVAKTTASEALSRLAGYGVLTLSNSVVSGATAAAYAAIDGKSEDEIWDAALMGAAIAAVGTVFTCAMAEVMPSAVNLLKRVKPIKKVTDKIDSASAFISEHQVHLKNTKIDDFLTPKSIYQTVKETKQMLEQQNSIDTLFLDSVDDILPDDTTKLKPLTKYHKNNNTYYTDDTGKIMRINNDLLPDETYKINGYEYKTDSKGRIIEAKGILNTKADSGRKNRRIIRDSKGVIGNGDELPTDSRGHLIADQFDGGNGKENIVAQDTALNTKEYKNLEQSWANCISEGKEVNVSIKPVYETDTYRPTSFDIDYSVDGEWFSVVFNNGV